MTPIAGDSFKNDITVAKTFLKNLVAILILSQQIILNLQQSLDLEAISIPCHMTFQG